MKQFIMTMFLIAQAAPAQTWLSAHPEIWQQIKEEAQSADWRLREAAFHEVRSLGDLKNPETAGFLFDLLRRENDYLENLLARKIDPAEGWGDPYYSGLIGVCLDLFEQVPDTGRFEALASGVFNPDSRLAQILGRHASTSLPWLLATSRSAPNPYKRLNAAALLAHWLNTPESKNHSQRTAALSAVESRLEDTSSDTRAGTVFVLGYSGFPEACAILQRASARLKARGAAQGTVGSALKRCR